MNRALLFLLLPLALAACSSQEERLYDEAIDVMMAATDDRESSESEMWASVDSLMWESSRQGHGPACLFLVVVERARAREDMGASSASAQAQLIDEIEACPPVDPAEQVVDHHPVLKLIDRDTPEAQTRLDSLRILGVFERHPHIDPAVLS